MARESLISSLCVPQVFASLGGMVAPPLGTWLLASTGQWYPLYAISAAIHLLAGGMFFACASDTPARQLLYAASRSKAKSG